MAKTKSDDNDFFNSAIKSLENEYASTVEKGIETGDVSGWISTGSYALNALISGSIYGGVAANKITTLAGDPSTGKSFYALNVVGEFFKANPTGYAFYFETESAIHSGMLESRGINKKRFAMVPVSTVEEFRTQSTRILDKYLAEKVADRKPIIFVLDSLGNLSTSKEMEDIQTASDKRDMTRAPLLKGAFRVLNLKLGKAKVPLIVTNHVYALIGAYGNQKDEGGGSGSKYASTTTVYLSKSKFKEQEEIKGVIIKAKLKKSRLSVENRTVTTLLRYDTGLDKYYGLLELAVKFGVVQKATSSMYTFPNGFSGKESEINKNPEKFYTKDVLDAIDAKCPDEFLYGNSSLTEETSDEEKS